VSKPRKLIAGNWKMNGLRADGTELAREIAHRSNATAQGADSPLACDLLICPPATLLMAVAEELAGSAVALGGQDCHQAEKGAHTGDISAWMLKDAGCSHVILGHSERRSEHGEESRLVRAKAAAAHRAGLVPIICIGETEAQRDAGETLDIVATQLAESLPEAWTAATLVIAYEPVWAIGTGRTPTREDVATVHAHIRGLLTRLGSEGAGVRILYGGSVKAVNAGDLLAVDNVDGALVGGASLSATEFWSIARSCG
jgi:triosephosphate isomerase (TIM)